MISASPRSRKEGSGQRGQAKPPIGSPPTASAPRDYVAIADAYAREAIADEAGKKFGKWLRLAAARYLRDREAARASSPPFLFDEWHACDACDFIEKLPHVEGVWETPTIVLHPAHVFFVVNLFGFRRLDGGRRFTSALFAIARKNAKSTLGAAILLYCFCCEPEVGPQVVTAATTGDQARIVFGIAQRMVQKTADLREAFTLEAFVNAIARYEVGGSFKPINAKASTQDGLNPSHVGLDEIHAHKTHDLLNVLQSAAGARANPLFLYTTTEGYENPGPWGELRHFAKQLLQQVLVADHFLVVYFAVDEEEGKRGQPGYREADGDFDEAAWVKANPLIEVNPHLLTAIRKEAVEAKAMKGRHAEFKIKRLNRPSAAANNWVDINRWLKCGGPVNLAELRGEPCTAGLDLASVRDFSAFRLAWKIDGTYYTWGRRWVPKWSVAQRTERGTVPYAEWVAAGYLIQTEGDVADYAVIERDILDLYEKFAPSVIAYDRWNASDICNRLTLAELPMVEFIQGPKSYHPAMQELERAYIAGKLCHGGDRVLAWCASNLVARTDPNMNTAPDRRRSPEKIDDMCALLMAIGAGLEPAEAPAEHQLFFA